MSWHGLRPFWVVFRAKTFHPEKKLALDAQSLRSMTLYERELAVLLRSVVANRIFVDVWRWNTDTGLISLGNVDTVLISPAKPQVSIFEIEFMSRFSLQTST